MDTPLILLALLPAGATALTAYALRPRAAVAAPRRLTLARTAVAIGGYGIVSVEVLSAYEWLTVTGVGAAWLLALAIAGGAAAVRRRHDGPGGEARALLPERWHTLTRIERTLVVSVAGLMLAELVLALLSAPNTYDSQTYHLPRIEHWVAQQHVSFYPVRIHRQVTYAPGAEYLLAHFRLLTGADALYGLLQWSAGLVATLAVTRLTAQLGGGRRAQLLSAFVLAATPAVVLESSSTQTDLVVAAWVACLATMVLDGVGTRKVTVAGPGTVVLLGVATGLIAVTKQTGLLAAGPLLVWWGLARLRQGFFGAAGPAGDARAVGSPGPTGAGGSTGARDAAAAGGWAGASGWAGAGGRRRHGRRLASVGGVVAAALVVLGLTATLTGPYVWRVYSEFGHPLGPDYLRRSVTMQRHDPPAVLVNAVRQAHTLFDTPVPGVSALTARGVESVARALGIDPQDPAITFDNATFPTVAWYPSEDKAAYPIQALLLVAAVVAALVRPRRLVAPELGGPLRAYACAVVVTIALHAAMVKWQPWGNRLVLYVVVLAAALAGLALNALFASASRPVSVPATGGSAASGSAVGASAVGVSAVGVSAVGVSAVGASMVGAERTPRARFARRFVAALAVVSLAVGGVAGALSALYGWPRRLVGSQSVFVLNDWESRFVTRPSWADDYASVGAAVRGSGARRIGVVQQNDTWEYPWWLLFPGREQVALQSMLPRRPADRSVQLDAIVCAVPEQLCRHYAPPGWQVRMHGTVGYALPPERTP